MCFTEKFCDHLGLERMRIIEQLHFRVAHRPLGLYIYSLNGLCIKIQSIILKLA